MVASLRPVSYILKTSVTLSSSSFESCWVAGLLLALLPAGSCFGDLEDIVVGLNRKHTKPNAHETVHCYNSEIWDSNFTYCYATSIQGQSQQQNKNCSFILAMSGKTAKTVAWLSVAGTEEGYIVCQKDFSGFCSTAFAPSESKQAAAEESSRVNLPPLSSTQKQLPRPSKREMPV